MVMSDISYSAKLRELSKDYYQNHIQLSEYRLQRKIILDKIDEEFNGQKTAAPENEVVDDQSMFMSTIAFFKNNDVDQ
jgi:hypothetical protein